MHLGRGYRAVHVLYDTLARRCPTVQMYNDPTNTETFLDPIDRRKMMRGPLTTEETVRIREMLDDGRSHNSIGKQVGRAQSTISEFAKREGYSPLPDRTPRVANQARRDYGKAERLDLLNQAFEEGKEMLERGGLSARDFKELMTAIAITIDKRRLEEGEPQSVHETRSGHPHHPKPLDLQEEFRKLDEELVAEARDHALREEQHRQALEEE